MIAAEQPSQGLHYQVSILTTERGRFVLKQTQKPELIGELTRECQILSLLHDKVPFVPAPVGSAVIDGVGYYLFTCIEGDNLLDALYAAPLAERQDLAFGFGQALAKVHSWTPDIGKPDDWLAKRVARAKTRVEQGLVPNPIGKRSQFKNANPADVLAELMEGLPHISPKLVFGHGDYAVTNAIVHGGQVVGVIDWREDAPLQPAR